MFQKIHTLTIGEGEAVIINGFPVTEKLVKQLDGLQLSGEPQQRVIEKAVTRYAIHRSWVEIDTPSDFMVPPDFLINMERLVDLLDEIDASAELINPEQP